MESIHPVFPIENDDRVFEYEHFFIVVSDARIGVRYFICYDGLLVKTGKARHDNEALHRASHWLESRYYSKTLKYKEATH